MYLKENSGIQDLQRKQDNSFFKKERRLRKEIVSLNFCSAAPPIADLILVGNLRSTVGFYSYHLAAGLIFPTALLRKAKLLSLPVLVGQEFLNPLLYVTDCLIITQFERNRKP